ncbi:ATPase family AAA domain-containing protein 1-A, partial [Trifolium medium]|nr:ATPase family AAA domain-containing protein 1-A [Trifolium medium]
MTEGYSGSDLKNLCMTAAYRPVKELMQQEKEKEM